MQSYPFPSIKTAHYSNTSIEAHSAEYQQFEVILGFTISFYHT
jgi:hypothetical protein